MIVLWRHHADNKIKNIEKNFKVIGKIASIHMIYFMIQHDLSPSSEIH
jgi:hypothetical protein